MVTEYDQHWATGAQIKHSTLSDRIRERRPEQTGTEYADAVCRCSVCRTTAANDWPQSSGDGWQRCYRVKIGYCYDVKIISLTVVWQLASHI